MGLKNFTLKELIVVQVPNFRSGLTQQYEVSIEGKRTPVYQSERSYAIGKRQRGFVVIGGMWYQLPKLWTLEILGGD